MSSRYEMQKIICTQFTSIPKIQYYVPAFIKEDNSEKGVVGMRILKEKQAGDSRMGRLIAWNRNAAMKIY